MAQDTSSILTVFPTYAIVVQSSAVRGLNDPIACRPASSFKNEILPETKTFFSSSATSSSSMVEGFGQYPQQSYSSKGINQLTYHIVSNTTENLSRRWVAPRATYLNNIVHGAEEGWMAMKIDFPVLRLVPFAVEK